MPFKPVPFGVKVAIRGHSNADGTPIVNTFGMISDTGGPFTPAQMAAVAAAVETAWVAQFIPILASDYNGNDVTVTDVTASTGPQAVLGFSNVGGVGSEPLPLGCAGVIKWTTGLRGRKYRGRSFIAPIPNSYTVNGNHDRLTVSGKAALAGAGTNFIAALTSVASGGSHFSLALLSTRAADEPTEGEAHVIVAATPNDVIGFQRRRRK